MTLVSACVCCLFLCWHMCCESRHGFGLYCFWLLSFYKLYLGKRLSISFQYVCVDVVIVSSLLSLLIVYHYLSVTGTVFLKHIEVCNAGQEFVNGWGICFWLLALYLLELSCSVWKFMLSMALILCFLLCFLFCLIDCHSVA